MQLSWSSGPSLFAPSHYIGVIRWMGTGYGATIESPKSGIKYKKRARLGRAEMSREKPLAGKLQ